MRCFSAFRVIYFAGLGLGGKIWGRLAKLRSKFGWLKGNPRQEELSEQPHNVMIFENDAIQGADVIGR